MMIRANIWRKTAQNERNGMIMDTLRRRKSMEVLKNDLMLGEDRLEVRMDKGCLNHLNRIKLGNNSIINFSIRWELMISGDLVVIPWKWFYWPSYGNCMVNLWKSIIIGPRVRNHSTPSTMSQTHMSIENI
jgi:hypothetical protein